MSQSRRMNPSPSELKRAHANLSDLNWMPSEKYFLLLCHWSAYDPLLETPLKQTLSKIWSELNPAKMNQLLTHREAKPDIFLAIATSIKWSNETEKKRFSLWIQLVTHGISQKTLDKKHRIETLTKLLSEKSQITVEDYMNSIGGGISRRQAARDLLEVPDIEAVGNTQARYYKLKGSQVPC